MKNLEKKKKRENHTTINNRFSHCEGVVRRGVLQDEVTCNAKRLSYVSVGVDGGGGGGGEAEIIGEKWVNVQ